MGCLVCSLRNTVNKNASYNFNHFYIIILLLLFSFCSLWLEDILYIILSFICGLSISSTKLEYMTFYVLSNWEIELTTAK